MAMISILVCSRIGGNKNSSLFGLLDSLKSLSASYDNFEVLVKFDDDDKGVNEVLPRLSNYPFRVRYLIEPRCRGYVDLHVFYNRLFSIADEKGVVIGAMGDDFEIIEKNWDELILSKTKVFADGIYVIHGRPHPPYQRADYEKQKFFLDYDIDRSEDLEIIDEAPFWSRKLLNICGGLGHLSFTDLWTLMLEYYLYHRCGMNRTLFTDCPFVRRVLNPKVDKHIGPRWTRDRANNFAFARSTFYKTIVEYQALTVFAHVKMEELALLPPPIIPKTFDTIIPRIEASLVDNLKSLTLNSIPAGMRPGVRNLYSRLTGRKSEQNQSDPPSR